MHRTEPASIEILALGSEGRLIVLLEDGTTELAPIIGIGSAEFPTAPNVVIADGTEHTIRIDRRKQPFGVV